MNKPVENMFIDLVEVKHRIYDCQGKVPLYMNDNPINGHKKENIMAAPYKIGEYEYYGPFTHEYYIDKYEELFRFRIHDEICSVGVLYRKLIDSGYRSKINQGKYDIREPYAKTYHDKSIDTFNVVKNPSNTTTSENLTDFYSIFHPKSSGVQELYNDEDMKALVNSVNFNHIVTTIMDLYNINNPCGTQVTPEELGIYRTTTDQGKAIMLSEEKLDVIEGKIFSVLKEQFKLNLKLWGDDDLNKLHERKIEIEKGV